MECKYKRNASEEWPRTERLLDCSKPVLNYRNFWTPLEARTEDEEASCTYYVKPGIMVGYRICICLVWWGQGFVKYMGLGYSGETVPTLFLIRGNGILV